MSKTQELVQLDAFQTDLIVLNKEGSHNYKPLSLIRICKFKEKHYYNFQ